MLTRRIAPFLCLMLYIVLMLSRYTDILEAAIEDADKIMAERQEGKCLTDAAYAYGMMMRAGASDNSNII